MVTNIYLDGYKIPIVKKHPELNKFYSCLLIENEYRDICFKCFDETTNTFLEKKKKISLEVWDIKNKRYNYFLIMANRLKLHDNLYSYEDFFEFEVHGDFIEMSKSEIRDLKLDILIQ